MPKHVIADPAAEVWLAAALLLAGAWLLHDAYENRGRQRPFVLRFLPAS